MHVNSRLLFEAYALDWFTPESTVLEVGALAMSPFAAVAPHRSWKTANIAPPADHLMRDEYTLPDGPFDVVMSAQVLEHVRKPWTWMREIARVTRPGGIGITIVPTSWPFHEAPVDCWRVYPEGMRALCDEVGLD